MRWLGVVLLGLAVLGSPAWGQDDEPLRTVADNVRVATVSPDRQELAFYDGSDLQVWDFVGVVEQKSWVSVGTPVWLRFSPDHTTLVAGVAEGRVVAYGLDGHRRWAFSVHGVTRPPVFSADGKVVGLFSPDRRVLDLVRTDSGQLLASLSGPVRVGDAAFSPTDPSLAVGWEDGRAELWTEDGSKRLHETRMNQGVRRLAWSPSGLRLLVGEGDTTVLLGLADLKPVLTFHTQGWRLWPSSWSPGGGHFALAHFRAPTSYGLSLRELPSGRSMRFDTTTEKVELDWSPDDHLLAVTTDQVRVYRLVDGDVAYQAPDVHPHESWFAPSGHRIMVWTWDGTLKVWDF